jgi:NAD(P)-dependent dehydrogenase (short-subunit alcohol dehydrogenase family)
MLIQGSTALVTGANRGLGTHFADALIDRGADRVYACARNPETLAPLLAAHGQRVVPLRLDVTDPEAVATAAARAGDCTLLVNNAGVLETLGLMEAGGLEPLQREMAVNVYGLARMCQAFAPLIAGNGGGAIVNMLSVSSLYNYPPFGTYCASKATAMSLTECLRYELKDQAIEVFGVYAGLIDTDMVGSLKGEKTQPQEVARAALDGVEAGVPDIDADQRSKVVRAALRDDPAAFTAGVWEAAANFRAAHPLKKA